MTADRRVSRQLRDQWRRVVLIVVPVLLTPIFMYLSPVLRCAFEMCLLNCYLLLKEIPPAISALLPVCLAPLLGPMSTEEVCAIYFGPSQLYFISAAVIAVAAAESMLSRRLALYVLTRLGPGAGWLVGGTVLGSVLLCFVFNSVVTALLLVALVDSICDELCLVLLDPVIKSLTDGRSETTPDMARTTRTESNTNKSGTVAQYPSVVTQASGATNSAAGAAPFPVPSPAQDAGAEEPESSLYVTAEDTTLGEGQRSAFRQRMRDCSVVPEGNLHILKYRQKLRRCLLKGVIYGSTLASTAQLYSPAYSDLLAFLRREYPEYHVLGSFTFMFYSMPTLILCSFYLGLYLLSKISTERAKVRHEERRLPAGVFENRLVLHGAWTFRELSALAVAVMALVIAAIPKSTWTSLFTKSQVTPETLVLLLSMALFSLPAQPATASTPPVLPWAAAKARFPWSCLALTACGEVHAAFFVRSGMHDVLIRWVKGAASQRSVGFLSMLALLSTLTAELTNKDKSIAFLLPTLDAIVRAHKVNPLKLMLPVSRLAAATFSISTASQNNALLRDYGGLSALDMMIIGGQLHVVFAVLELLSILSVGYAMFDLDSFPYWALPNATRTTGRI